MKYIHDTNSKFRILKGEKISLIVSALVAGSTLSFAAPTGGQLSTGNAIIHQSGLTTTINQSTDKASINWQSFSIGANETVNFVQPSASSITLNRVLGTTSSLIEGAMNANGQVFLINPNGVVFANGSQVNVGGLVASTLNITDANFQSGNYVFEGGSQNGILNMGTITTPDAGYVAMMGKIVQNEGIIVATMGNVQMAGGDKISINLNGNSLVKLTVDQGTVDALVENKGLIKADGGQIYLTTQAIDTILDGMVNNSGVIEAQTLNDVIGKIQLFAHGGTVDVSGTLTTGSSEGFIETSGKEFSIQPNTTITAGNWLIDPVNITIDDTLAGTIQAALDSADVTITTDGTNTPDTVDAESSEDGNILVESSIAWATNKTLTLSADNDINVNTDITHTGSSEGGLIFLYGQGTVDGGTSVYNIGEFGSITSPSIQWRKGSALDSTRYAIVDGDIFVGGKYIELAMSGGTSNGSIDTGQFGVYSVPSLFFGTQSGADAHGIGMLADADGFASGDDLRIDYFIPGDPWEAYSIGYNGETIGGSWSDPTTDLTLMHLGTDDTMYFKSSSMVGNLNVEQIFSLQTDETFFKNNVTLTNISDETLNDIVYVRHFDPDNTVDIDWDLGWDTINTIESKISEGAASSIVSAISTIDDDYYTLAGGKQAKVLYYTNDSRAIPGIDYEDGNEPFWGTDISDMLADASIEYTGYTTHGDTAIGMIFNIDSLAAYSSTDLTYITSLENRDLETIITELNALNVIPEPISITSSRAKEKIVSDIVGSIISTIAVVPKTIAPEALKPNEEPTQNIAPVVSDTRVALAENSLIELVDGGMNLPVEVGKKFAVLSGKERGKAGKRRGKGGDRAEERRDDRRSKK